MRPALRECTRRASAPSLVMAAWLLAGAIPAAQAQLYMIDPRIDIDKASNTYFGSTKDADGRFLGGVTVEFSVENTSYVIVTDEAGRFRMHIPKYIAPATLKFNCSKPGFALVRATKRKPPGGAVSPVQADCVMAPKTDRTP